MNNTTIAVLLGFSLFSNAIAQIVVPECARTLIAEAKTWDCSQKYKCDTIVKVVKDENGRCCAVYDFNKVVARAVRVKHERLE